MENNVKISYDKRNYRIHNDKNKTLIQKSLKECGSGRSILIDKNGEIIAGNGVYEQAAKLGIPVKVVESDGKSLIAIQRTDLDTFDAKRKKLAVMDNSTGDTSMFDMELLKEDFEIKELDDLGIDSIGKDDIDTSGFFDPDAQHEPNKKTLVCPHCGEVIEL